MLQSKRITDSTTDSRSVMWISTQVRNVLTVQRPCKAGRHCCTFPAAQRCACVSVDDRSQPHFSLLHNDHHPSVIMMCIQAVIGLVTPFTTSIMQSTNLYHCQFCHSCCVLDSCSSVKHYKLSLFSVLP